MTTLIRTEWLKMRKYNAFWWILGITAISYPGINYMLYRGYIEMTNKPTDASQLAKMAIGNPYAFPDVWHSVAFFSSIFVFIPAVVVIMFITNEYTFKTHRQNIIDGWSRSQFITSKLIDVLLLVFIITLLYFSVVLVSGFANHTRLIRDTWGKVEYAGLFALQTFSQLSIAFLVGFLIRRAFLALGVFLFYFIVVENALVGIMKNYNIELRKYLPFEISDRIIPVPPFIGRFDSPEVYKKLLDDIFPHVIYTILLTSFIWFICYRINNRRDLK